MNKYIELKNKNRMLKKHLAQLQNNNFELKTKLFCKSKFMKLIRHNYPEKYYETINIINKDLDKENENTKM